MEQFQSTTDHIVNSVNTLESLHKDSQDVKAANDQMLAELAVLRQKITENSARQTDICGRSRAMREKIVKSEECIKSESASVKGQIKKYFKTLGLHVDQEPMDEAENFIEVRVSLKEVENVSFSLAYDVVSDDFECELNAWSSLYLKL